MSAGSEAVLYDIDGDPMAVTNGTPIPSVTSVLVGGGSDGTNAQFIKVDSSGNQIMIGLGTAGSPAGGVLSIQGVGSGTPVPVSGTVTANAGSGNFSVVQATAANLNATVIGTVTANIGTSGALALDATLAKLTIAPGTAIGSNTLALIGGHVTTASPTYTNGNINPLSLTTAGALRVDGSTVTQPISGTVTANQGTSPWVSNITQFGSSNVVTGTGTSGSGIPRVTVSNDSNILATQSGTWTVAQGAPNTLTNRWPVQITDGTNTMPTGDTIARSVHMQISDGYNGTGPVAVKDGYVAPTAEDRSLVVVLSPNQQAIPVTSAPSSAITGVVFGRFNYGAGAGTIKAVRATTYTPQSSNFTGSVVSSNANDTSAGTGARTVKITYYTATGTGPFTETVTMNGTTAVNLVNSNHCFIEKMEVITTGSLNWNAGTITLFTGANGTGTAVGSIGFATNAASTGDNRTLWAHHYVPIGKTASIYGVSSGTTGNQIGISYIQIATPLTANTPEILISDYLTISANGPISARVNANPIQVTGFCRVTMYVVSNGTNTNYFVSFDYSEI